MSRKKSDAMLKINSAKRQPPLVLAAAKALKALQRPAKDGGMALEAGPTPERLARAGQDWKVDEHHDAVVEHINSAGRREQVTVKSNHVRIKDAPFDRLVSRCLLAPGNSHRNAILAQAGERYRELWHLAGLGPISAQDMTREGHGSSPWAPFRTEHQLANRIAYRKAREALQSEHRMVLDEVVLAEQDLATAGRNASGRWQETAAIAVAVDRIACACATLARHFGTLAAEKD